MELTTKYVFTGNTSRDDNVVELDSVIILDHLKSTMYLNPLNCLECI